MHTIIFFSFQAHRLGRRGRNGGPYINLLVYEPTFYNQIIISTHKNIHIYPSIRPSVRLSVCLVRVCVLIIAVFATASSTVYFKIIALIFYVSSCVNFSTYLHHISHSLNILIRTFIHYRYQIEIFPTATTATISACFSDITHPTGISEPIT
jgi:hypothetical protein